MFEVQKVFLSITFSDSSSQFHSGPIRSVRKKNQLRKKFCFRSRMLYIEYLHSRVLVFFNLKELINSRLRNWKRMALQQTYVPAIDVSWTLLDGRACFNSKDEEKFLSLLKSLSEVLPTFLFISIWIKFTQVDSLSSEHARTNNSISDENLQI